MNELNFTLLNLAVFANVCSALPYLTRPELFFAVTVTREFRQSEVAIKIIRQYNLIGWAATFVCAVVLFLPPTRPFLSLLPMYLAWLAAYLFARSRTLPYRTAPTTVRQSVLSRQHDRFPGGLLVALGPFVILAGKAVYTYLHWDQIPDRFPVHWGFNGPDRWTDRTPMAVYGSFAAIAAICTFMIGIAYGMIHGSRTVSVTGPAAESERKFRKGSVLGLVALAYVMALALPPIEGGAPSIPYAPFVILIAALGLVGISIRYGQGGSRLGGDAPSILNEPPIGDRTPDDCWKLGFIYYNPSDPAFIVEKRFGIGWTVNFGNRWTWLLVPLSLVPLVLNRL